jgi:GT2 family glycosyltransferase
MTDFEVLVCDDGLDDRTADVCGEFAARLDVFCSRTAAGKGAGYTRNRGAEIAAAVRVLFLDDDCVPAHDVAGFHIPFSDKPVGVIGLRRMVKSEHHEELRREVSTRGNLYRVESDPDRRVLGAVSGKIANLGRQKPGVLHKYAFTCHVSYPRLKLWEVGGFCEEFRGAGFEDLELALRLTRVGLKFQACDFPLVYHLNHPQSEHQTKNFEHNRALYHRTVADKKLVQHAGGLRDLK